MNYKTIKLSRYLNLDGSITIADMDENLPFEVKRFFIIQNVSPDCSRGSHACESADLLFVCVNGYVTICLFDGHSTKKVKIKNDGTGLFVPKMHWIQADNFSEDGNLLVLASETYKKSNYIESFDEYIQKVCTMK